jgi:hypothetical protein
MMQNFRAKRGLPTFSSLLTPTVMAETGKKQQVQLETEIRGGVASSAVFRGTLPESAGVSAEVQALSRTGKQSNAGLTKQVFG